MEKAVNLKRLLILLGMCLFAISCTQEPTAVPSPVPTAPLPTRIVATRPVEQNVSQCVNSFIVLDTVNYSDGTIVQAGEKFLKEWEVMNYGTCDWVMGYKLRFVSGDQLGAPSVVPIAEVAVGKKGKFVVEFTAPTEPGTYQSLWKAFSDTNRSFGNTLSVEITVQ